MKVAFVNQPIDSILPPGQNSVGACTYGVANYLARSCDVLVYGAAFSNQAHGPELTANGVRYKFFSIAHSDRWLCSARTKYSKVAPSAPPLSTSGLLYPSYAKKVALDLRREGCDVIHIQHCSQFVQIIRKYNPRARIVLHLHAEWFSQGQSSVFEQRLKDVDLITAVSRYVVEKTRRDFPAIADRCELLYNGVDTGEFIREKDYRCSDDKPKRILYAGAISPHRGLHVLLKAFRIVVRHYPNVCLDLVGPEGNYALQDTFDVRDRELRQSVAPYYSFKPMSLLAARLIASSRSRQTYRAQLESMLPAEVSKRVIFHGFVSDRAQLVHHYYASDIFVLPSICNDSFGIPVVEAMAAGTPVVASRSGGVVETVKDCTTGFLVDKNDPEQLAYMLVGLLENDALREKMGRAGRERAMTQFAWDRAAATMLARYRSLAGYDAPVPKEAPLVPIVEYASAKMVS
jgi:glycosyltransferase involved in cell wall biosynthesis